jgi:DNA-directed RNA polymerase subunit L
MADAVLKEAVSQFIERMEDVTTRLHNAIEDGDADAQHAALAAIVGLIEMLRSAADNVGDEPDPLA